MAARSRDLLTLRRLAADLQPYSGDTGDGLERNWRFVPKIPCSIRKIIFDGESMFVIITVGGGEVPV